MSEPVIEVIRPCAHGRLDDHWIDSNRPVNNNVLCVGSWTQLTRQEVIAFDKAVAVMLRREFPDLLSSTDDWRPIARMACKAVFDALLGETDV